MNERDCIICCSQCYHNLIEANIADLWRNICSYCHPEKHLLFCECASPNNRDLKKLEKLGAIVTHETDNKGGLFVKALGYFKDSNGRERVCFNPMHRHEGSFWRNNE